MANKIWLTYAWKDNENTDVDFVIQSLTQAGLHVGYDRVRLVAGRRIWPQLDNEISDPARCDAWAIFATKNSFSSEPCLEELSYALDRALRTRGGEFPIIGIFPEPMDRSIIPSAIAARLYVTLQDPGWATKVMAGVSGKPHAQAPHPKPFLLHVTEANGKLIMELRPRAGRWYPFVVLVPNEQRARLLNVLFGPSELPPEVSLMLGPTSIEAEGKYSGLQIENPVDPLNSAYVYFSESPTEVVFGQRGAECFRVAPPDLQR